MSKRERIREIVLALLKEHRADPDGLPTTLRFLFYEMEQRGEAVKPEREGPRKGHRRSIGWPAGSQDITDEVKAMRDEGVIPWDWIADEERSVEIFNYAASVQAFLNTELPYFRLNPWSPEEPPVILTESKGMARALRRLAYDYVCPISGLKGQSGGFLMTEIAPILNGELRNGRSTSSRAVLFLGDYDRSGFDIENNARRVLEEAKGCGVDWTRIALTQAQIDAKRMEPIFKTDERDKQGHDAYECEALGQSAVVDIVRRALASRLNTRCKRSLRSVRVQERAAVESAGKLLKTLTVDVL